MKKTTRAHSNIAFIKYWGKKDEDLRLPSNGSISMNLSNLYTTTTVEFDESLSKDDITINNEKDGKKIAKVVSHLDRIRALKNTTMKARIVSVNNFPTGVGLSSSATGFAALTTAAILSLGMELTEKEMTVLARLGSGSACRSIPTGYVEWKAGETTDDSYAVSLYPPSHWDLVDIVALTSTKEKYVATTDGQKTAQTSPFFKQRMAHIEKKIEDCKLYIKEKNFSAFGKLMEEDALEMHAIMFTSHPPLLYWLPETILIIKKVLEWRKEGIAAYFTINTGQNVHVICQKNDASKIEALLREIPCVMDVITNTPSRGSYEIEDHLF